MITRMKQLKVWEIALAVGVLCALLSGVWAQTAQASVSDKLVRLHVVANSDSEADQALKLQVRDRVLSEANTLLESSATNGVDAVGALDVLEANLPLLQQVAQREILRQGYDYPVRVLLQEETFPTREYDGFSLPAGQYQALRVVIGTGAGQNWWCVVFPPLCTAAVQGDFVTAAREAGLTDTDIALIAEEESVQLKFRCVELWETLRQHWV